MNIINYFESKEKELQRSIKRREQLLSHCPEGILQCHRNSNTYTWYKVVKTNNENGSAKERTIIKKDNIALARKLAIKGYNIDALEIEEKQLKEIAHFLKFYPRIEPGQRYQEKNAEYLRLSLSQNKTYKYSEQEWAWMNKTRPIQQEWQDELTVPTILDYNVRSKSESEYISKFVEFGIVFRYEWPTKITGYDRHVFPDFRILNTKTGEEHLLEHFGKMDDPEYVTKASDKLEKYLQNYWLPGNNLFISYETKADPFTSQDAEEIIHKYFPQLIRL